MALHFSDALEESNVEAITDKFKFVNSVNIEKFMMDFEMDYHINNKMRCTTRGGMCMPFHTDVGVRRLSIDIDLITNQSLSDTEKIMSEINSSIPELEIKKKIPRDPHPIKNLLAFDVFYDSCLGGRQKVKVDFICDVGISLPVKQVEKGFDVLDLVIDFEPTVLTHGALIGDKLTTLALQKIGLREDRFSDIPKQIYDIATLIKSATVSQIKEALDVFKNFTTFKVSIYEKNPRYEVNEIVESIIDSIKDLLLLDSMVTITKLYKNRFTNFTDIYLSKSGKQYQKNEHISDILIVFLFTKYVSKFILDSSPIDKMSADIFNTISSLKNNLELEREDITDSRTKILENFSDKVYKKHILRFAPLEHVFLINELNKV